MSIYPHTYRTKNSITKTTASEYAEFIQVPSISGYKQYYNDVMELQVQVKQWLNKLNVLFETFDIGSYEFNGEHLKIPPVILGSLIVDKHRPTIGVYAHIDIKKTDNNWDTDPYKLTKKDGCFFGAGTACGKGPLLMWFHAINTFNEKQIPLPVNIKFCIESMHECGHQNLEAFIRAQKTRYLKDIDHWVVNDSAWIGNIIPCLVYGATGNAHFKLTSEKVEGSSTEPQQDLENIHSTFLDENEEITIEGFNRTVEHITPDEELIYEKISDFDVKDVRLTLPENKRNWNKLKLLMHFWRIPSLKICDIEECTCPNKDELPIKVKSLLLFKIVPNQFPELVDNFVQNHVQKAVKKFNITNTIECQMIHGTRPWTEDLESIPYVAAKRATIQVYKEVPSLIREDESFSIILILQRVFKKEILLLPLGRSDGNAGKPNENIGALEETEENN
ncbi:cytosolic non-specific dipeptidase-like [Chrysoperla carnea]|uniref:cytosolic non-specific dipeptidase-like n=1 Tax=Chrysoperla carnea TaxID=189513 RepID=UPI001D070E42|nr:cytosolic non-specific dipeptidase-like [Chrysoperla carnea]